MLQPLAARSPSSGSPADRLLGRRRGSRHSRWCRRRLGELRAWLLGWRDRRRLDPGGTRLGRQATPQRLLHRRRQQGQRTRPGRQQSQLLRQVRTCTVATVRTDRRAHMGRSHDRTGPARLSPQLDRQYREYANSACTGTTPPPISHPRSSVSPTSGTPIRSNWTVSSATARSASRPRTPRPSRHRCSAPEWASRSGSFANSPTRTSRNRRKQWRYSTNSPTSSASDTRRTGKASCTRGSTTTPASPRPIAQPWHQPAATPADRARTRPSGQHRDASPVRAGCRPRCWTPGPTDPEWAHGDRRRPYEWW